MALGDASWYAAPVDHHSGSTGGKYPASSWPQPMVDNSRVCAAGKSDRLMGVCVHPMAEPRHNSCPLVAAPSADIVERTAHSRKRKILKEKNWPSLQSDLRSTPM
jgi:hypothetical protein